MVDHSTSTLAASNAFDVILSADQKTLYLSRGGNIEVFDLASHTRVATWKIGTAVGQLTLSEDGTFLLAADPRQPLLYRVSTATGAVTGTFSGTGNAYSDIEIVNSKTAIVTNTDPYSQAKPSILDLETGIISPMTSSANGGYFSLSGRQTLTEDLHLTLITDGNSSGGPLHIFDDRVGMVVANSASGAYNYGVQAISEAAGLVIVGQYGQGVALYDLNLKYLRNINVGAVNGIAFDPSGKYVYIAQTSGVSSDAGYVAQYDTATFNEVARFNFGTTNSTNSANVRYGDNLLVTNDGRYLIVTDPTGFVKLIDTHGGEVTINGSDLSDSLSGTGANETLLGFAGDDSLFGGAGKDTLNGGAGNDNIDGGGGIDTAVYSGLFRSYTVHVAGASGTVAGGAEGGTDSLTSVEMLRFQDGVFDFNVDGAAAQVMRLYDTVLQRAPDQAGLDSWVDRLDAGSTIKDVANGFLFSVEFQQRTGNLSNADYVEFLYQHALGRASDPQGKANWIDLLSSGARDRADLLIGFSESQEHRGLTADLVSHGFFDTDDAYQTVALLYDSFAGRLPDAAGLANWAEALKSGAMTLSQVASGFANSAEFQGLIAGMSHSDLVEFMYHNTLDRGSDPAGKADWVRLLDAGLSDTDLLIGFSQSNEHFILFSPHITNGIDYL